MVDNEQNKSYIIITHLSKTMGFSGAKTAAGFNKERQKF